MEDPEPLKAQIEKLKAEAESREAAVAQKQSEIDELQAKILASEAATPAPAAEPVADVDDLMAQIAQLQESLTAKDAEIAAAKETTTTDAEDGPTKDELKEQLQTVKDELQGRTEATDELKLKNNHASQDEILKSQQENYRDERKPQMNSN